MPKRTDIKSILIIGAGPIVIGQACEFDYSGAQACKALREEGYRVILVNSNPATIMTDPDMADATYIEPITWQTVEQIIDKERPDAILPTMGGQTALNCALDLDKHGVLEKYGCELIGATKDSIEMAEDRNLFDKAMKRIGLECPRAEIAETMEQAFATQEKMGYPCIIRPSFTMGGSGGGIAYNREEFIEICERGFDLSPTHQLLIDESLIGWKEYETEVVRDKNDNCIIVCTIENFDPMGVHTGDSITVAPAQTLTDKEYQIMRNASLAVLREIGVETGGSNVQFGINPKTGRMVVIEMNPRVSRSSALASKATGFPIARIAAKLAVGYTLDELQNDITGGKTPASFEPTLDYVVTKIPRFNFEKFPQADNILSTQMKSVGEVMAIGRNFQESMQKALRGLEIDADGFDEQIDLSKVSADKARSDITNRLTIPTPERIFYIGDAFRIGIGSEHITLRCQFGAQAFVIFDDTVMHHGNRAGGMRMCVALGRHTMRCPARVGDAGLAAGGERVGLSRQLGDPADRTQTLQATGIDQRQSCRVITPILQPSQPFEQDRHNIAVSDRCNNSTHENLLNQWLVVSGWRWSVRPPPLATTLFSAASSRQSRLVLHGRSPESPGALPWSPWFPRQLWHRDRHAPARPVVYRSR